MFFERLEKDLLSGGLWCIDLHNVHVIIAWKEDEQRFHVRANGYDYDPETLQEAMAWIIFSIPTLGHAFVRRGRKLS